MTEKLTDERCTCITCPECGGTGSVWFSFCGKYLGNYRCDDLDELERCPECEGGGLVEMCDYCQSAKDLQAESEDG
jgi:hypothetical protein